MLAFAFSTCVSSGLTGAGEPGFEESVADPEARPNVILIVTDDQGHGDLSLHGNPILSTPQLDALAGEGVQMTAFYVSPVCAPTRASLLTGRYHLRTGVVDTYRGRAMMHPDEVTLAEVLRDAGYRTAAFGKWHLGDAAPLRPIDQGFEESLVHRGGGIGQPSDPPGGSRYFDPVLFENGRMVRKAGYVSDAYTDAAISFLERHPDQPFFVYLAFNCPHWPLEVREEDWAPYRRDYTRSDFPGPGQPLPEALDSDRIGRVYGMVSNLDANVGRLLRHLDERGLRESTLVVFLTDNGPDGARYNGGLRGQKGSVYEGGIRVPCFIRWPARIRGGRTVDRIGAHIDLMPSLLEACQVPVPAELALDGRSLLPLWTGAPASWPERTLYFQWHRGDVPEPYRACAARTQTYKLVHAAGAREGDRAPDPVPWELFEIGRDPFEERDLSGQQPELVADLVAQYAAWFADVCGSRGFDPPRIHVGSKLENPVFLTGQDRREPDASETGEGVGFWEVLVLREETYTVQASRRGKEADERLVVRCGTAQATATLAAGAERGSVRLRLPEGPYRMEAWLERGGARRAVHSLRVRCDDR